MISMTKVYQTRDGRPVRLLCVDGPDDVYPVIGLLDKERSTHRWTLNGQWEHFRQGSDDLIEAKTKRSGWINIYPNEKISEHVWPTREAADSLAVHNRVACIQIEWEE